jgi:post-segregation antitoxin (ccd killing protein)
MSKKREGQSAINLYLPSDLYNQIKDIAKAESWTMSTIVRFALQEYSDKYKEKKEGK